MSYEYKRPEGKLYRVSIKEWNKVFANRGRWPFVVSNIYLNEDRAIARHNISLFGKVFMWTVSPLFFTTIPFLYGFPDALKGFKSVVFDKEKGSFGSDGFHKIRHGLESQQWIKLMKLIGEES